MKNKLLFGLYFSLLTLSVLTPQPALAACEVLKDVLPMDAATVDVKEVEKCINEGKEAPMQFVNQSSFKIPNLVRVGFCGPGVPVGVVCPNNENEAVNVFSLPPPAVTGPPQAEPIPFGKLEASPLPCGAVGNLSQIALQSLWGNVRFNMESPVDGKGLMNSAVELGLKLLGQHADCKDGKFWEILNTVITVVIPQLNMGGKSKFSFYAGNSTFLTPINTMISTPKGGVFEIDITKLDAEFDLPAGGSFFDSSGQTIKISTQDKVHFSRNGTVTTASGKKYRVDPKKPILLDTNGLIRLPHGTQLPVPEGAMLTPMGKASHPPKWAEVDLRKDPNSYGFIE